VTAAVSCPWDISAPETHFTHNWGKVDVLKSIKDRVVWHTKTAVEEMQLFSPPKRVGIEWMHTHSQKK
jgi:hypothetical protein